MEDTNAKVTPQLNQTKMINAEMGPKWRYNGIIKMMNTTMEPKWNQNGAILLHPVRYKIIELFGKEARDMYIDEIAGLIGEDPRLTSFHLTTLQEKGYAESKFGIIDKPASKGRAGRFYRLTPKVEKDLNEIATILQQR